jgi:4-hydroxy-tetrahydrodipicolinate synthase
MQKSVFFLCEPSLRPVDLRLRQRMLAQDFLKHYACSSYFVKDTPVMAKSKSALPRFHGVMTALVTPFNKKGAVAEKDFQSHVEWQIDQGVHGLVPGGTTGESATLSMDEHIRVIELCVEATKGRVPVVAGTGGNSTDEAIFLTQKAEKLGADAALVVVPYYNKPTQEGLYQHFKAVHDATDLPIILYNVPGRTALNMSDATIARLSRLKRIIGIKDATGDLARVSTLRQAAGKSFLQLSGEDMTAIAFNAQGGVGVISVTANVTPKLCAQVQEATLKGDFARALTLHDRMVALHDAMFCETNPVPAKFALSQIRKVSPDVRLPLVGLAKPSQKQVQDALLGLGLL